MRGSAQSARSVVKHGGDTVHVAVIQEVVIENQPHKTMPHSLRIALPNSKGSHTHSIHKKCPCQQGIDRSTYFGPLVSVQLLKTPSMRSRDSFLCPVFP